MGSMSQTSISVDLNIKEITNTPAAQNKIDASSFPAAR